MHGFGIVGAGMIADFHARAIDAVPEAELKAVASRKIESARKLAEEWDVDVAADFKEMIVRDDIDVVCLTVPSGAKMEIAVEAAEAGKHLVLEKPIEVTLERADTIIEAARQADVKVAVIFQSRFAGLFRKLKQALDRGDLGRLIQGDCYVKWYRPPEYYQSSDWKGTLKLDGGGALINQSIHGIDLLGWLMGPVDTVFGYTDHLLYPDIEGEDTAAAVLRFQSGALGVIQGTTSLYPGFTRRLEIHGTNGSVIVDEDQITLWETLDKIDPPQSPARAEKGGASDPAAISFKGHTRQIADLCQAVDEDREPMINGEEGRKALELVLAIYRSAAEGHEIKLPL